MLIPDYERNYKERRRQGVCREREREVKACEQFEGKDETIICKVRSTVPVKVNRYFTRRTVEVLVTYNTRKWKTEAPSGLWSKSYREGSRAGKKKN